MNIYTVGVFVREIGARFIESEDGQILIYLPLNVRPSEAKELERRFFQPTQLRFVRAYRDRNEFVIEAQAPSNDCPS